MKRYKYEIYGDILGIADENTDKALIDETDAYFREDDPTTTKKVGIYYVHAYFFAKFMADRHPLIIKDGKVCFNDGDPFNNIKIDVTKNINTDNIREDTEADILLGRRLDCECTDVLNIIPL